MSESNEDFSQVDQENENDQNYEESSTEESLLKVQNYQLELEVMELRKKMLDLETSKNNIIRALKNQKKFEEAACNQKANKDIALLKQEIWMLEDKMSKSINPFATPTIESKTTSTTKCAYIDINHTIDRHSKEVTNEKGNTYSGEWHNDKKHGQGVYTWAVGGSAHQYIGSFSNGSLHGRGVLIYSDGRVFIGRFKRGRPYGKGEMRYSDGRTVLGVWNYEVRSNNSGDGHNVNNNSHIKENKLSIFV